MELVDVTVQTDRHIVFLHPGGGIDVDEWSIFTGLVKKISAALQIVGGSRKCGGAIGDVDTAEKSRLGHGSADAQIDAVRQLRVERNSGNRAPGAEKM